MIASTKPSAVSLSRLPRFVVARFFGSPCFEFVCLVRPPFDLHTLSHLSHSNDFFPSISETASLNSFSISVVSVSATYSVGKEACYAKK
jgi:hypothetical protein